MIEHKTTEDPHRYSKEGARLIQAVAARLTRRCTRAVFFSELVQDLKKIFIFDRLCINLYDQTSGVVSFLTDAEGPVITDLSPVRLAEQHTVAGQVIASRKPLIIQDIKHYFPNGYVHPMAEAGITTTMAFPLIVYDELLGTLHCSFFKEPPDSYQIMELFLEVCSILAHCLALVLCMEHMELSEATLQTRPFIRAENGDGVVFASSTMRRLMAEAAEIARLNVPVLILGETGTGKSMLAQHIHRQSPRTGKNFVKVNCPALAPSLFESELFGHVKGAFTGAVNKRMGRFELAHEGTLFLDEIGELTLEMQSKLLQVLEDSSFERVGESTPQTVDLRLVCATNVDMPLALASGKVRKDLYYRIAAVTLCIPPLREHPEDIAPLARYFVESMGSGLGMGRIELSPAVLGVLERHSWPGNIRELRNAVHRLLIRQSLGYELNATETAQALATATLSAKPLSALPALPALPVAVEPATGVCSLQEAERRHIQKALAFCHGVIAGPGGAARLLGLPRSTLQHRMRKLGLAEHEN